MRDDLSNAIIVTGLISDGKIALEWLNDSCS
jgi:hypothetical protein